MGSGRWAQGRHNHALTKPSTTPLARLCDIIVLFVSSLLFHFTFDAYSLNLSSILITHHHFDHTGGVIELKNKFSPHIYGPLGNINGIDTSVSEGDIIVDNLLKMKFEVYEIPGHTLDHIAFKSQNNLFCGDTIFSSGCGRVFEGTHFQMYNSLKKLTSFSDDTKIYCAHEYTLNNINFAIFSSIIN